MSEYDLVYIKWIDACGVGGDWETVTEFQPSKIVIGSVGWQVFEDEEVVVLASNVSREEENVERQFSGTISIPRCAILQMANISPSIEEKNHD